MPSRQHPAVPFALPAAVLVLAVAALVPGCANQAELTRDDLEPGEIMVATTMPASGEVELARSLGLRLIAAVATAGWDTLGIDPEAAATIAPATDGRWRWTDTGSLEFHPDQPYQPNTRYRVTLQRQAFADKGLTLRGPRRFDFTAAPFQLIDLDLDLSRVDAYPPRYQIDGRLVFNYAVDPDAALAGLSAEIDEVGPVELIMETTTAERTLRFRSAEIERDRRDRRVEVELAAGLRSAMGGVRLEKAGHESVVVPALERLQIRDVVTGSEDLSPTITLRFNENVLPGDLRRHLTITPEVPELRLVGGWQEIELSGGFQTQTTYQLAIDAGLAADNGLTLERDFQRSVTIGDLEPMIRITGPGNYLSLHGEGKVAVETVNLEQFDLEIQRIFPNNLVPFLQKVRLRAHRDDYYDWSLMDQGEAVLQTQFAVTDGPANTLQVTPVDLGRILDQDSRGIFRVMVGDSDQRRRRDGRWLVATDLGLVAKTSADRLEVAVASISKLQPVAGVSVQVLSRHNQQLATARTDAQGLVRFDGLGSDDPGRQPFVVVATLGGDMSFLALDETAIATADLDVGGVWMSEKGYRAFLYGDRDIYRPGETVHLVWMVRDAGLQPATGFPLNLKITGPGGEEFAALRTEPDPAGCGEHALTMPTWARTGRYTARLYLGERQSLGEVSFSVEEFMPDRMKVTAELVTPDGRPAVLGPGAAARLNARAMSLFGPPAADRAAEASVWYQRTPVVMPGYEGYTFGENVRDELPPRRRLGTTRTDAEGHATWELPLPEAPDYQGWLRLTALVSVTELGGGRAVTTTVATNYSPLDRLIGLRNLDRDGNDYRQPGEPVRFEGVMIDLDGQTLDDPAARLKLLRRHWRTVLRRGGDGQHRYVSEYDEKLMREQTVALAADGPTELAITPSTHGSYRLVLESGDGEVRGSIDFYVYGFGYSPWAMNNPETVNLKLDQTSYQAGDVVTASVEAPFAGLMLVTIERDRVYSRQWVRLTENTGTISVRLPSDAAPNVYLTATLLRSLDELDPRSPARAFGAQPVFIDRDRRTLPIEVAAAEEMRPRAPLTVRVKLPDTRQAMRLTVAAVDEGILQLTDYATPSALDHFLQRRRLMVTSHDIWSLLLPEYERVKRQSAAGGGVEMAMDMAEGLGKRLNPLAAMRVKPVALWSGLLEGRGGWQDITLDVPEFNGSLRVMVVATAGDRFGSAQTQVRVADPLVLSPSLPRFLAPGDRFRVPVPVYNGLPDTAPDPARVTVTVAPTAPVAVADQTDAGVDLTVDHGREEVAWFDLQAADAVGVARVTVQAKGGGEQVSTTTELAVRPPSALESRVTSGALRGEAVTVPLGDQWLDGTAHAAVTVAANPAAAFGAALPYLLRYPYGCLEQRTSRCFPLVHFGALAAKLAPGEFGDQDGDYFVNSGLDYLATLHRPHLGMVTWPGAGYDSFNPFANVYATHFLVVADQAGYLVPSDILDDMLRVTAGLARTEQEGWPRQWTDRFRRNTRAYACYVLAVAGQPERGAMDQLVQDDWKLLSVAARTHLAGAYALTGNHARFEQLLPAADAPVQEGRSLGFTWSSQARDEAMRLEVLATVDADHAQVPRLLERLSSRASNGRWSNTQENAFALLALGKLAAGDRLAPASGRVLVNDEPVGRFDGEDFSLRSREWAGGTLRIELEDGGMAWYSVLDEGVPRQADATPHDEGLVVHRDYLDTDGNPVDPQAITQGQTLVCRLRLSSDKGTVPDVVISDLVPAGLEIENPRLSRDGGYDWINTRDLKQDARLPIDHLEVRDDRLLLFTRAATRRAVFHYTLRAVTAGRFVLPPVRAEAMYDPAVMSTRGSGVVRVVAP